MSEYEEALKYFYISKKLFLENENITDEFGKRKKLIYSYQSKIGIGKLN